MEIVDRVCQQCGKHFPFRYSKSREGRGKFCSHTCFYNSLRGRVLPTTVYVERICQHCGKGFNLPARLLKSQSGEYCSRLCANRAKANPHDPVVRERKAKLVSITSKGRWQSPEYIARLSRVHKKLWKAPEFVQMMSEAQSKSAVERWQDPEYREHQIEAQKRSWEDPEIVARRFAGFNKKPNKPEQRLIDIFSRRLPQFQYNGDFSLGILLGGLIPDFINVNGKKEVIELFGDYFHSPEVIGDDWKRSELGKVMLYNSLGYRCLVIWEYELNELSEDELVEKVNESFSKHRRSQCHNSHLGKVKRLSPQ